MAQCLAVRALSEVCVCVFQVLASRCLTAVCGSAGGGTGCALAEQAEIDVLLEALLAPCFSVRDAALRVRGSGCDDDDVCGAEVVP